MDYETQEAQEWQMPLLNSAEELSQYPQLPLPGTSRMGVQRPQVMKSTKPTQKSNRQLARPDVVRDPHHQRFCCNVPEYSNIQAIGAFQWPEGSPTPQQCFGNNLQALDAIRVDHSCWILCDTPLVFRVLSASAADAKRALCRIRTCLTQARELISDCSIIRLIESTQGLGSQDVVELVPVGEPQGIRSRVRLRLSKPYPAIDPQSKPDEDAQANRKANTAKLASALIPALTQSRSCRDQVNFEALYGKFLLTSYKPGKHSVADLEHMLGSPQCEMEINSSFRDTHLLQKFQRYKGEYTLKTYGAHFLLDDRHVSRMPGTALSLSVEYEMNALGDFDRIASRWAWAKQSGEVSRSLDISLINVERSMAWNVYITTLPIFDPAPYLSLLDFEASIDFQKANINADTGTGSRSFLHFALPPTLRLLSMKETVTHKFPVDHDSRIACNVINTQERAGTTPGINCYWSVSLSNDEWTAKLLETMDLGIGEQAEATSKGMSSLPVSSIAVEQFVNGMKVVEDIIHNG